MEIDKWKQYCVRGGGDFGGSIGDGNLVDGNEDRICSGSKY